MTVGGSTWCCLCFVGLRFSRLQRRRWRRTQPTRRSERSTSTSTTKTITERTKARRSPHQSDPTRTKSPTCSTNILLPLPNHILLSINYGLSLVEFCIFSVERLIKFAGTNFPFNGTHKLVWWEWSASTSNRYTRLLGNG